VDQPAVRSIVRYGRETFTEYDPCGPGKVSRCTVCTLSLIYLSECIKCFYSFYSTFSNKNPFLNIIIGGKHKGIEKSVTDR
jgi:hypothetical protein